MTAHIILYVKDQKRSARFYGAVLNCEPTLDVPGMTEFQINVGCVLGLMPEAGIRRLLGKNLPDPARAYGVPRAEVYLRVSDARQYFIRALEMGAKELSGLEKRDWGDVAGYCLDPDGHVLAFASQIV